MSNVVVAEDLGPGLEGITDTLRSATANPIVRYGALAALAYFGYTKFVRRPTASIRLAGLGSYGGRSRRRRRRRR